LSGQELWPFNLMQEKVRVHNTVLPLACRQLVLAATTAGTRHRL
jgi:hypothetical protein